MSRIRALKNRADFRKGGYVNRQKFQGGGIFGNMNDFEFRDGGYYHKESGLIFGQHVAQHGAPGSIDFTNQGQTTSGGNNNTTTIVEPPKPPVQAPDPEPEPEPVSDDPPPDTTGNGNTGSGDPGFQNGGSIKQTTDRVFGARTTDQAPAVDIRTKLSDPAIQTADEDVQQIAARTATDAPKVTATATQVQAAQSGVGQAAQQAPIQAGQMTAAQAGDLAATQAAQGQVTREAQAETLTLSVEEQRQLANLAGLQSNQGTPGVRALTGDEQTLLWNLQKKKEGIEARKVQTAQRDTAQEQAALAQDPTLDVGQDAFVQRVVGEQVDVVQTTAAEKQQRQATIGMPAPSGAEAQVINEFGFGSSKNRILRGPEAKAAAAGRLVSEHGVSQQVAESILQDVGELVTNIDGVSQEALGAIAALPKEALVSSQMESLLAGMEEGKTPLWARPAVALIEERLAERGLEASSVGRDALFNSIIQSALPIAQSNAQALQQRASQNLSNEQQALIQDRQVAADFLVKNAAFKQNMDIANLSNDQQMRLANLTAQNQAGSENLSAAQQTELAGLNSRMQSNLLQSKLAQEMGVAQLSVDQQTAMNNASTNANIDFTKYTTAQQNSLANSKFMQTMTMTDFNANQQSAMQNATTMASMDVATADQNMKLAITNAQNFLQMDMSNLSNSQQSELLDQQLMQQRLLSNQSAANASRQFNATSQNQTDQFMANLGQQLNTFNTTQLNAMNQFNTSEANRTAAINAQNDLAADQFNSQAQQQVNLFDQDLEFKKDQWNAQNAQAVEQSNVAWRRKSNTMDTAAQNESNKMAAQFSFNMSMAEQNYMWQELRDDAAFAQQTMENVKERAMQVLSSIYGNAELMTYKKHSNARDVLAPKLERLLGLA